MIVVIDSKMGNTGSIINMLRKIGVQSTLSGDLEVIENANKLILPGVGAFDHGMEKLNTAGFIPLLKKKVLEDGVPILGVCLGMQLFCRGSEEGSLPGLGWIAADTVRFDFRKQAQKLKIPHMGWNMVNIKKNEYLFNGYDEPPRFYFAHSYHVRCDARETVAATVQYGFEVTASIEQGNIFGAQFHPEKSHKFGLKLLKNFVELC